MVGITGIPIDNEITELDHVFGRGGRKNTMRLDSPLRRCIQEHWTVYTSINHSDLAGKRNLIGKMIETIAKKQGRFLYQPNVRQGDETWYMLRLDKPKELKFIHQKIAQSLRDEKKKNKFSLSSKLAEVKNKKGKANKTPRRHSAPTASIVTPPRDEIAATKPKRSSVSFLPSQATGTEKKSTPVATKKTPAKTKMPLPLDKKTTVTPSLLEKVAPAVAPSPRVTVTAPPPAPAHPGKKLFEKATTDPRAKRDSMASIVSILSESDFMSDGSNHKEEISFPPIREVAPMADINVMMQEFESQWAGTYSWETTTNKTPENDEVFQLVVKNARDLELFEMEQKVQAASSATWDLVEEDNMEEADNAVDQALARMMEEDDEYNMYYF